LLRPIFLKSNWKLTQYSAKPALKPNVGFNFTAISASTRLSRIQAHDVPTPTIFTVIQAMAQ
jgi:hypothetical protein